MALAFDQSLSIPDNLARFRKEAERIDLDCARILFDNLELLTPGEDATYDPQHVEKFNEAVLAALNELPEEPPAA